jgi:hypothetical protein
MRCVVYRDNARKDFYNCFYGIVCDIIIKTMISYMIYDIIDFMISVYHKKGCVYDCVCNGTYDTVHDITYNFI